MTWISTENEPPQMGDYIIARDEFKNIAIAISRGENGGFSFITDTPPGEIVEYIKPIMPWKFNEEGFLEYTDIFLWPNGKIIEKDEFYKKQDQ